MILFYTVTCGVCGKVFGDLTAFFRHWRGTRKGSKHKRALGLVGTTVKLDSQRDGVGGALRRN